jgi:hypothetical protein
MELITKMLQAKKKLSEQARLHKICATGIQLLKLLQYSANNLASSNMLIYNFNIYEHASHIRGSDQPSYILVQLPLYAFLQLIEYG